MVGRLSNFQSGEMRAQNLIAEGGQTLNATTATNATMHIPITKTAIAPGS
jgi:hypothetical protein